MMLNYTSTIAVTGTTPPILGSIMTKKIYYEKVGRRYKPVYEHDQTLIDSFSKGTHLVDVYPGGSSRRYNIDPAYAPMIAAGRVAEDAICEQIRKQAEMKPQRTPITLGQQRAWKKLAKEFGDELCPLTYGCARDLADAAVKAMQAEAEKLLINPTVRKAYERFLFISELAKEHNVQNDLY
jgi:hypothetical protein